MSNTALIFVFGSAIVFVIWWGLVVEPQKRSDTGQVQSDIQKFNLDTCLSAADKSYYAARDANTPENWSWLEEQVREQVDSLKADCYKKYPQS